MSDPRAYVTALNAFALPGQPAYFDAPELTTDDGTWSLSWAEASSLTQTGGLPLPAPPQAGGDAWVTVRPKPRPKPKPVESPPLRRQPRLRHASGSAQGGRQQSVGFARVIASGSATLHQRGALLLARASARARARGFPQQHAAHLAARAAAVARAGGAPWHWEPFAAGKARALACAKGAPSAAPGGSCGAGRADWSEWIAREDEQLLTSLLEWDEVA